MKPLLIILLVTAVILIWAWLYVPMMGFTMMICPLQG